MLDGLFLSVFPMVAGSRAFAGVSSSVWGYIGVTLLGIAASECVAIVYRLGYPEFRNSSVHLPAPGNGIIGLAYAVSFNPISSLGSRTAERRAMPARSRG